MKTTKIILLIAAMAIATVGFSQSESSPVCAEKPAPAFAAKISLKAATQNADLVKAIHAQLNPAFLKVDRQIYIVPVKLKNTIYYISGSQHEWLTFFSMSILPISQKD